MATKTTLKIKRTYDAPADRVFEAWTNERVLRRWFHAERGWQTPEAQVDLRVGGAVRIVMRDPEKGEDYGGGGEYTVVEPPRRLAFTWAWDREPEWVMLIEIEFDEEAGRTTVHFTHSGLRDEEALRSHRSGWDNCFDNLERALVA